MHKYQQHKYPVSNRVKHVFDQVQSLIYELLDKIGRIYHRNRINFEVTTNLCPMMRMLIPFELKYLDNEEEVKKIMSRSRIDGNRKETQRAPKYPAMDNQRSTLSNSQAQFIPKMIQTKTFANIKQESCSSDQNPDQQPNQTNPFIGQLQDPTSQKPEPKILKAQQRIVMEQTLQRKLSEYIRRQVSKGKALTRDDVQRRANQIGFQYNVKLGDRWIKDFIGHRLSSRDLLTHKNSGKIKRRNNRRTPYALNSSYARSEVEYEQVSYSDDSSVMGDQQEQKPQNSQNIAT